MTRAFRTLPVCAVLILAATWIASAGDLNPPAGPVAPTQRTPIGLNTTPGDADSFFKIIQPGSYYLTGNITGGAGRHGVEIAASGVTLDLNGFELLGTAGSLDGVSATAANLTNIAVINGSVRSWGDEGVDLGTLPATSCRVTDVRAGVNAGTGIFVGFGSTVTNCAASGNDTGIFADTGSTVSHCSVRSNTIGIRTNAGCTVTNCSAASNTGIAILVSTGSTVVNCAASFNSNDGIVADTGCTVSNCSAAVNLGNGISVNTDSTVSNSSAVSNAFIGINANHGSTVSNCSANTNSVVGISATVGCTVADCSTRGNVTDGIVFSASCVIRGNTCAGNGNGGSGAGIHAIGGDNRIDGNNCAGADRGIDVGVAGNVIVKNTCAGNTTDWVIAANNVFGPIIDRRAPASAAVSGFAAPSSLGTTDANANFSY